MSQFWSITLQLLEGFKENCILFGITLIAALPLGLLIAFGSMSRIRPIKYIIRTFVWIIRGTPLLLQLFVVYYIPPMMTNGSFRFGDRMSAATLEAYLQANRRITGITVLRLE